MGTTDKNCNGIVIEVSPIPLEHQIIPLMFKYQPIDRQESLNIIEAVSKLPRKNFPGLTYQRQQAPTPRSNDLQNIMGGTRYFENHYILHPIPLQLTKSKLFRKTSTRIPLVSLV